MAQCVKVSGIRGRKTANSMAVECGMSTAVESHSFHFKTVNSWVFNSKRRKSRSRRRKGVSVSIEIHSIHEEHVTKQVKLNKGKYSIINQH